MSIGPWQLILILLIILVIFGAGKLPGVMGDIGRGIKNLKEGLKGEEQKKSPAKKSTAETKPKKDTKTTPKKVTKKKIKPKAKKKKGS